MITLITGQPGDGKTLYTIAYVKALAEREGRAVYYNGIPELKLPWLQLDDPEEWWKLPAGAIIVIDEAQRIFRPRSQGSAVPQHVAELETHRHRGHDLFIITQQPLLVDANVRRLVGRHFHAKRRFGMQVSTVHEWSQVKERPDQNRTDSVRHEFNFPKSLYGVYKSAELHTHKVRIPMRFWFLVAAPFAVIGCLYLAFSLLFSRNDRVVAETKPASSQSVTGTIAPARQVAADRGTSSPAAYLDSYKPRIADFPHTAPRYDAAAAVVNVPYPAACLAMGKRCKCYTDQATVLQIPEYTCRDIVERGYFVEFAVHRAEPRPGQQPQAVEGLKAPSASQEFTVPGYVEVRRDTAALGGNPPLAAGGERAPDPLQAVVDRTRPVVPMVGPFSDQ